MASFIEEARENLRESKEVLKECEKLQGSMLKSALIFLAGMVIVFVLQVITGSIACGAELSHIRDDICMVETRGFTNPQSVISPAGAVGECQIKPGTAYDLGFKDIYDLLRLPKVVALMVLEECAEYGHSTAYEQSYCYCAGRYAKQVAVGRCHSYSIEIAMLAYQRGLVRK